MEALAFLHKSMAAISTVNRRSSPFPSTMFLVFLLLLPVALSTERWHNRQCLQPIPGEELIDIRDCISIAHGWNTLPGNHAPMFVDSSPTSSTLPVGFIRRHVLAHIGHCFLLVRFEPYPLLPPRQREGEQTETQLMFVTYSEMARWLMELIHGCGLERREGFGHASYVGELDTGGRVSFLVEGFDRFQPRLDGGRGWDGEEW